MLDNNNALINNTYTIINNTGAFVQPTAGDAMGGWILNGGTMTIANLPTATSKTPLSPFPAPFRR